MYKRRVLAVLIMCCCLLSSIAMPKVNAETTTTETTTAGAPSTEVLSIDEMASRLGAIGYFTADAKGDYYLLSQVKRSDAIGLIVSLMGKTKFVNENKSTYSVTGFKDVNKTDWFAASVGFCVKENIIGLNSTATFRPNDFVSEKEFAAMLLRVLGYSDVDYTWSYVYQKAYEIMLFDDISYQTKKDDNKNFKKADLIKLIYTALNLKPKYENMTLIQKLVNIDAISYNTAIASKILKDQMPSSILKVSVQNEQRIKVTLNEKINIQPENIKIYDAANMNNQLSMSIVSQTDTELIIKTAQQTPGLKYCFEISKVIDTEGNTIQSVSANFLGYSLTDVQSDLFKVSKIEQKDDDEVNVYFTHPVNENALSSEYYEILENGATLVGANDSESTISLLPNKKGVNILLKNAKFKVEQEYSIKISTELISAYGVNFESQTELSSFIAKQLTNTSTSAGFDISKVTALSYNTIQVDFSMEIDQDIAEDIYMYKVTDSNDKQIEIVKAQLFGSTGKSVMVTVNGKFDNIKNYYLTVNFMVDATGQYTIKKKTTQFSGYYVASSNLLLYYASIVDESSVIVCFNMPLNDKQVTDISNFALLDPANAAFKALPKKVVYSADTPNSVKLYFSKNVIKPSKIYTVRVMPQLQDYFGNPIGNQLDYSCSSVNMASINMTPNKAVIISPDTIKLTFNRDIAIEMPNILTSNYSIEYKDKNGKTVKRVPIAITYVDNTTIVLKFTKFIDGVEYTIKYKEIKDIAGDTYSDRNVNSIKVTMGK